MSVVTHLKILSSFERWAHGHDPVTALLEDVLAYVKIEVTNAIALRLYHLNEHGVQVGASTVPPRASQVFMSVGDDTAYREVLSQRQPAFDAQRETWIAPLSSVSTTYGVIEVSVGMERANGKTDEEVFEQRRNWLALIASYLSQALDTRALQELSRQQAMISSRLTQVTRYREIVEVLAEPFLDEKQFITINQFIFDAAHQPIAVRVIATANRHQTFDNDEVLDDITIEDLGYPLARILTEARPFIVFDIPSNETIHPKVKAWMAKYGIRSICAFPMRSQDGTFGFIALNSVVGPLYLAETELAAYQSLTDQVSTLIQLGRVTAQAGFTLAVSERQKQAFNELIAGQDFPEMAGIIARHMLPESGRFLAIAEITYDSHGAWTGWRLLASANRHQSYRWDSIDTPVALHELAVPFSNSLRDGEILMISDVNEQEGSAKLGEKFAAWLRENRIRAFLNLPIILNDRPIATLSVTSIQPVPFSQEEINAFTSLAGQMGVLVQVRYLLEQARTARNLVDNLVLANRLVAIAADERFMAQSVTYTLARQLKGAVVTLFDRPLSEGQQPLHRAIVGLSSGETLIRTNSELRVADLPSLDQLSQLHNGQPVIVPDLTQNSGFFSPETRSQLLELGAVWVASFGIRSTNRLLGTLDILNDKPYPFTSEEIDGYTSLADQIGTTIRSRQLLQQSQAAQMMATQLVQANMLISTAENFEEMALAVVSTLPETIDMTAILLFNEPISINEHPEWVKTEVLATRDGTVIHPEIFDHFEQKSPTARKVYGLDEILSGVMLIIEDLYAADRTIIDNLIEFLRKQNLRSVAAIGLRTGMRFLGIIAFGAKDFRLLDDLHRENLRAIAGEVAVAIENRLLVQQTADALTFVAQQYHVSNALYRAQNAEALLVALYEFMQEYYTSAELTIFSTDSDTNRTVVEINSKGEVASSRRNGALLKAFSEEPDEQLQRLLSEEVIITENGYGLLLPLKTTDSSLLGTLEFLNSAHPVSLPPNTMRALRGLADQMTTGLQNQQLLLQTETALQETRRLYTANQALLSTTDIAQVLKVVREVIAPDSDYVVSVTLGYNIITGDIASYKVDMVLSNAEILQPDQELAEIIGEEELQRFKAEWDERNGEILLVENAEQATLPKPILNFYQDRGVKVSSYAMIPIIEDGLLSQVFVLCYRERRLFPPSIRRLMTAIRDQMTIVLQNQRLIRDTRASATQLGSQVRVLQTLNQLAINLSITQDEQSLLFDACAAAYTALRVDRVGIVTLNNDGENLTVSAEYPHQTEAFGTTFSALDEIQQTLLRERTALVLNDLVNEKRFSPKTLEVLIKQGIRSMLLIPLVDAQDTYYGSIGLNYNKPDRSFSPDMVHIARSIAAQTVVSLQNTRQVQRVEQQAAQLQQLARFSQSLQSTLEVPAVLEALAASAPEILPHDHLSVMLYDNRTGKLRLVLENTRRMNQYIPIDMEITTSGAAWSRRDLIHIPNVRRQSAIFHTFHASMMSILSAPIFARGIALGVIEIASYTPFTYTETDVLVFRQLVNQVGVALENAETYSQSQRLAKSKALVNDISNQIQKQMELDGILKVTMNELGRALGAKQGRIQLGTQADLENGDTTEQW